MDLHAHAVAGAVAEETAVARLRDHVAAGLVRVKAGHAVLQRRQSRQLRLQHDAVDLFLSGGGLSHRHGARHVGMVPVLHRAEIQRQEVAGLNDIVAGHAVGQGTLFARHGDGLEGERVRPVGEHVEIQLQLYLLFRHAGPDEAQHVVEGLLRDRLGRLDLVKLLL